MSIYKTILLLCSLLILIIGCSQQSETSKSSKIRVLLDTDANNELDDQHAIAYLLLNGNSFTIEGITVNRTNNGGDIIEQAKEAERIVRLCDLSAKIHVAKGASGSFAEIKDNLDQPDFDGFEAVDLIIKRAKIKADQQLILLPVGKLTNIALALKKDPTIAKNVKIVWLGSNYPQPGEYNQVNDESALSFILDNNIEFEIVLVRYDEPSGTDAVRVTPGDMIKNIVGKGPRISQPVTGRHGGSFFTFGDYSIDLFEHIELDGDPPSRALFDMAAVAIVKNPLWATPRTIPAPMLQTGTWVERPDNTRKIIIWEDFKSEQIISDFYATMNNFELADIAE
jgi:inosine-uridine nucleoside N-ribohydrolase